MTESQFSLLTYVTNNRQCRKYDSNIPHSVEAQTDIINKHIIKIALQKSPKESLKLLTKSKYRITCLFDVVCFVEYLAHARTNLQFCS